MHRAAPARLRVGQRPSEVIEVLAHVDANVVNIGRYCRQPVGHLCRNSDTRWLRLRLNVDSSAHAAISAPTVSARSLAGIGAG
ncbi:MAG: hypothetical protein IPM01_29490 [Burkholderiaceae bacterium]|nr:hypothetical protein [Burkholderiaceae bacterium]